jgi:hypothetical protein
MDHNNWLVVIDKLVQIRYRCYLECATYSDKAIVCWLGARTFDMVIYTTEEVSINSTRIFFPSLPLPHDTPNSICAYNKVYFRLLVFTVFRPLHNYTIFRLL